MKLILLTLVVLCTICNIQALLREQSRGFRYDDKGKILAHCQRNCMGPASSMSKYNLLMNPIAQACSRYRNIQACVAMLNECWMHNTIKARRSYCQRIAPNDFRRMEFCHQRSADFGLELLLRRTPNQIGQARSDQGEFTQEYIK